MINIQKLKDLKKLDFIGAIRKLDNCGRVGLPIEYRKMLDININDNLSLYIDKESECIIITKFID